MDAAEEAAVADGPDGRSRTSWNAYARGIDHGDEDLIRQVYHDGAIDEHGIFSGEGDAFAAFTVAANPRRSCR